MRKTLVGVAMILGCGVMGCQLLKDVWAGVTGAGGSEQIKKLAEENAVLAKELEETVKGVKAGTTNPLEAAMTLNRIRLQIEGNLEQIKKIQSEGQSTGYLIGTVLGLFGRTAAHGLAGRFPMLAPFLTLILGGSETKKAPTPTT